MRPLLVAGNWKMHGSLAGIDLWLERLLSYEGPLFVETVVFPPFVYLHYVSRMLLATGINCGAQNVHECARGAFTGEVSAPMLLDIGCQYVLVGHSERRCLYGETDALIAKKFVAVKQAGLIPILCVGETLAQREQGMTFTVIAEQLKLILSLEPDAGALNQAVVAYEPVWAIGTGRAASADQAQAVHAMIRDQVARCSLALASQLCIIYGGSVKANNASELFKMPDIDGALIGGASLDVNEFIEILNTCHTKR